MLARADYGRRSSAGPTGGGAEDAARAASSRRAISAGTDSDSGAKGMNARSKARAKNPRTSARGFHTRVGMVSVFMVSVNRTSAGRNQVLRGYPSDAGVSSSRAAHGALGAPPEQYD